MNRAVMQGLAVASLGGAFLATKHLSKRSLHEAIAKRTRIVAQAPSIAETLSHLTVLNDASGLNHVMDLVEEILYHDLQKDKSSQWHISRLSGEVVRCVIAMCDRIPVTADEDVFYNTLLVRDEYVPQLTAQLEALLHNHLLRR